MIREQRAPRKQGDWCRDMSSPLAKNDVIDFPYTVLEVKLQDEPADWVNKLTGELGPKRPTITHYSLGEILY